MHVSTNKLSGHEHPKTIGHIQGGAARRLRRGDCRGGKARHRLADQAGNVGSKDYQDSDGEEDANQPRFAQSLAG